MREKLLAIGAKEYEHITEGSEGFVTASLFHPFGNVPGFMYNPHYPEILNAVQKDFR